MRARKLAVEGAWEFTPKIFRDPRGLLVSPLQDKALRAAHGRPLFPVVQCNHSQSRRGVVRGLHYTVTPPGTAKYLYCPRGEVLDIVVDIRVGSPTFGRSDAVLLDQRDFRSVYLPVGVGHAFVALTDDTVVSYLLSSPYVADHELALSALDPELGLPIPTNLGLILSGRDRAAPRLAEAKAAGLLPDYEQCKAVETGLTRAATGG